MTIDGLTHGIEASKRATYYRQVLAVIGENHRYESIAILSAHPWTVLCPCKHRCFIIHCYHVGGYDSYAVCPTCKEWGVCL